MKTRRKYEMRRRAERQRDTRRRIVEATVALHEERGMLGTTVSDVAARAGVERATVYRHFPDERALITACTTHYFAEHPVPDPTPWLAVVDPETRLRRGLAEIYSYHRSTEAMMSRTIPELPHVPSAQEILAPTMAHWSRIRACLADGWPEDVTAVVGHAIGFSTWTSLVREQGLTDKEAIEMMVTLVRCMSNRNLPT